MVHHKILIKSSNDRYKATLEPMGATLISINDDTNGQNEIRLPDNGGNNSEIES